MEFFFQSKMIIDLTTLVCPFLIGFYSINCKLVAEHSEQSKNIKRIQSLWMGPSQDERVLLQLPLFENQQSPVYVVN